MSDPRYTDPRYSDPRLSDPVLRHDESVGGVWGWIAGLAVIALVAFLLIAGWNSNSTTASNNPRPPAAALCGISRRRAQRAKAAELCRAR